MDNASQAVLSAHLDSSPLRDLLDQGFRREVYPGGVFLVGYGNERYFVHPFGFRTPEGEEGEDGSITVNPVSIDTVYDVGEVTGSIVTATLVLLLVEEGKVSLDDRVGRYLQAFGVHGKSPITLRQLLNHTSGLPATVPFFEELERADAGPRMGIMATRSSRDFVLNYINRMELRYEPGTRQRVSEVGTILLGFVIEALTGLPLDQAVQRHLIRPLGLRTTGYVDIAKMRRRDVQPLTDVIAPTEHCPWRKRIICGEVHNENAWAMGGVSGHAGIFSCALDLHRIARELSRSRRGESEFLSSSTLRHAWSAVPGYPHGWRCGWDSPSIENGLAEAGFSESTVGVMSHTGCALWIDPVLGVDLVFLSNRTYPSRSNKKLTSFLPRLFSETLQCLRAAGPVIA